MDTLLAYLSFILVLSVVIFVHEFGHFVAARICGIKVISFCIGIGPKIFTKRIGDTFYSLAALPLGGYVRPLYRIKEESKTASSTINPRVTATLAKVFFNPLIKEEDLIKSYSVKDPGNFLNASVPAKLFFYVNGIVFNILLAIIILTCQMYKAAPLNRMYEKPYIGVVKENTPAYTNGLKHGDLLVSVEGQEIGSWKSLYNHIKTIDKSEVTAIFKRKDTSLISITVLPKDLVMLRKDFETFFTAGFEPATYALKPTFLQSLSFGFFNTFKLMKDGLLLFRAETDPDKLPDYYSFSDPVLEITQARPDFGLIVPSYNAGKESLESPYKFLTLFLTFNLIAALLNLIPYPAFDGGQIVTILAEAISGKELSHAFREKFAVFGLGTTVFILLLALGADILSVFNVIASYF